MIKLLHAEFYECLYWAALCFVSGVSLREFARDQTGKWLGRLSVFVGFFLLAAFGQFSIKQCQVLYANTPEMVSPVSVVAVEKEYAVNVGNGIEVSWTQLNTGGAGSVSIGDGRGSEHINTDRGPRDAFAATGLRPGSLSSEESGTTF